jgi:hypothetical protein
MPHAQDEDARRPNLVAHLVLAHENAANLARLVLIELLSEARLVEEPARPPSSGFSACAWSSMLTAFPSLICRRQDRDPHGIRKRRELAVADRR